ncbi:hypothetical protein [Thiorhodococcus minor]|uniref:hypothetical protein n=1 Tax=Thiorhodococcus minor TaxID=57489 RepID=UPI001FD770E0|nr:hypothetical protein [Thiorhodococcus minor]
MQKLEGHLAPLQALTVFHRGHPVPELGAGTGEQLDVAAIGQLADPGQIVVVLVRVTGVANPHALLARGLEIGVHVAADVEHEGLAGLLGADEIGRVAQTLQIELLEEHRVVSWAEAAPRAGIAGCRFVSHRHDGDIGRDQANPAREPSHSL